MIAGIFDFFNLEMFEADVGDATFEDGDMVVFKSDEPGEEMGKVSYTHSGSKSKGLLRSSARVLRKATANDLQKFEAGKGKGGEAVEACKKLAEKHCLDMQPFYAQYSLDGLKANIIFTADDRVDFRELVKDLAKNLQKQIHLKQIGPRDKARITDGYGRCGRRFCCRGFLPKLESISMDMVRVQALESKGSSKLSGACGKLLCCLRYEVEAYDELKNRLPNIGSKIKLKKPAFGSHDEGYVVGLDILNQKMKVHFGERDYATVAASDVAKVLDKPISTAPRPMSVKNEEDASSDENGSQQA